MVADMEVNMGAELVVDMEVDIEQLLSFASLFKMGKKRKWVPRWFSPGSCLWRVFGREMFLEWSFDDQSVSEMSQFMKNHANFYYSSTVWYVVVFVCIRSNVIFPWKAGIGKQFFVISSQFSHMLPDSAKTISTAILCGKGTGNWNLPNTYFEDHIGKKTRTFDNVFSFSRIHWSHSRKVPWAHLVIKT